MMMVVVVMMVTEVMADDGEGTEVLMLVRGPECCQQWG